MGNGFILLGLFGIASVIAGEHENVYTGIKTVITDTRTYPALLLVIGLMVIGNISGSKGWKNVTTALSVLIAIAFVFSLYRNPIISKGEKNG